MSDPINKKAMDELVGWLEKHPPKFSCIEMPFDTYVELLRDAGVEEEEIQRRVASLTDVRGTLDGDVSAVTQALLAEGFDGWHTGGHCRALGKKFERHEILITDGDYGLPKDDDEECNVGLYSDADEYCEPVDYIQCRASDVVALMKEMVERHGLKVTP
jgi:hypothetical protein